MKKKYWIKDLTEKQAIHAPTKEIAQRLCKKFEELGLKWRDGDSYIEYDGWKEFKEESCFRPSTGYFGTKKWYEDSDYEVLSIDQLKDFDEAEADKNVSDKPKNIKKYWIKDLTEKQVIHVPTKKISEKLCKKFDELGFKWYFGESYLDENKWEKYKEETCYRPKDGRFSNKTFYEKKGYEILTIDQLLDFQDLSIEVGKFYRTRDGRKVRIYSTQNGGDYPIHGAIEINGNWEVYSWKEGGEYHEEISQFHLDIVSEWVDEIEFDVETLPKLRYIAMDRAGCWCMFTELPTRSYYVWKTYNESFYRLSVDNYPKNYNGSWEDSLHEIVDGELIKVVKEHV